MFGLDQLIGYQSGLPSPAAAVRKKITIRQKKAKFVTNLNANNGEKKTANKAS